MSKINEGNVYNVQQEATPSKGTDVSKTGLDEWSKAVRKEAMEKLRGYAPEKVDEIIQKTFGTSYLSGQV